MTAYELVGVVVAIFGFISAYSYKLFYHYVVDNEQKVRKRVEKDILEEIKNYKKTLKEYTVEGLVDKLSMITSFSDFVDQSKQLFEKYILWGSVITILCSVAYVYYEGQPLSNTASDIGILGLFAVLWAFYTLTVNKSKIERYLNDEPIEDILEEQ